MVEISRKGPMEVGMRYRAKHIVMGREHASAVEVMQLQKNKAVKLRSDGGDIIFTILYELAPESPEATKVVCTLEFELTGLTLTLARPAIESMAKTRLTGDLETLGVILKSQSAV